MSNKKKLWRGLTTTTASLLSLTLAGTVIANANIAVVNRAFGTSNYQIINTGENLPSDYHKSEFNSLKDLVNAKKDFSESVSAEGSVLLKNENKALPLNLKDETVTLWGMNSHTPTLGGMIGSSVGCDATSGQKVYGLEEALAEKNFKVNEQMKNFYASDEAMAYARRGFGQTGHGLSPAFGMSYANPAKYPIGEVPANLYSSDVLSSADGTTAIVVISRDASEAADYNPNMVNGTNGDTFKHPLSLSEYERQTIELAKKHSNGKVIVLLNTDNPVEIEELKNDDKVNAILWVGLPGMYGFLGVADVLSGASNPSGKLADTYAVDSTSSPAMQNFGVYTYTNYSKAESGAELTTSDKADWYVVESEGIYIGYKYYETRYEDAVLNRANATSSAGVTSGTSWNYADEVSYSFGYGISYTTFEQSLQSVEYTIGGKGIANVKVTNTGDVAGKDVVELYVQSPYTVGGIEKSAVQLMGFAKTEELKPNQSVVVSVEFDPQYMASYSDSMVKANGKKGAWVLDQGDYYFTVANGAHEAINNILSQKGIAESKLVKTSEKDEINSNNVIIKTQDSLDAETYSKNVENALQDCDLNTYLPGTVEYTTRSDWSKGWKTYQSLTPTKEMMVGLTNSKYELTENGQGLVWGANNGLKITDMIILDDDGNYVGVVDFEDEKWDLLIDEITIEEICNFVERGGDDFQPLISIGLPKTYANDGPLGFSFDQVAGYATRWDESNKDEATYVGKDDEFAKYSMATLPTEQIIAATFNQNMVERAGELLGEDGLWANETTTLSPGANLHRTPYCGRNHEYYSEDAMLSNIMTYRMCKGGDSKGMMMEPKHLSFNHQEMNRSGISTFFNEQAGRENELRSFQGAFETNVASGTMTAFNRVGTTFSGAHYGIQTQILRNEWGFKGWIVTDMVNGADYMNWRDIVFGGGGTALTAVAYETSKLGTLTQCKNIIEKDTDFQICLKTMVKYWVYNHAQSNGMNGLSKNSTIKYVLTPWQKALIATNCMIGALTVAGAVMYVLEAKKANKEENL